MKNDFVVISYGSEQKYYNNISNLKLFTDKIQRQLISYTRDWLIQTDHYIKNKFILDNKLGAGFWAWKPFIILDALKKNDRILYMDSNTIFNKHYFDDAISLINSVDEIGCLQTEFINKIYTSEKCFRIMKCDDEKYFTTAQVWAGVIIATKKSIPFLEEWLMYCNIPDAICSDDGDNYHRHDQSILTNLIIKHGIKTLYNPNIFIDNANYRNHPQTLEQL